MRRILLASLAAALFIPAFAMPSAALDPQSQLVAAAAGANVPIYSEELLVMVHGDNTFAAAPIQGFENISAAGFSGGVDMAFAYIDFPGSGIPAGNYTLRGRAPGSSIGVGQYAGTIELVDANGDVTATLPAKISTSSATVPSPLPYPRSVIIGAWKSEEDAQAASAVHGSAQTKAAPGHRPAGRYFERDSNGWLIHYVFVRIICPNGSIIEGFVPGFPWLG